MYTEGSQRDDRPTLPPIRDIFAEELGLPPRRYHSEAQLTYSPSTSLSRLSVSDDEHSEPNYYPRLSSSLSSFDPYPTSGRPRASTSSTRRERVTEGRHSISRSLPGISLLASSSSPQLGDYRPASSAERYRPYETPITFEPAVPSSRSDRGARDSDRTPTLADSKRSAEMPAPLPVVFKYECEFCGKGFNRPSSLKIHVNSHTGEKPFLCSVEGCGRSFSVLSNMRRHARTHDSTTPTPLSVARSRRGSSEEESDTSTRRSTPLRRDSQSSTTSSFAG